jgi:hypothetical protein
MLGSGSHFLKLYHTRKQFFCSCYFRIYALVNNNEKCDYYIFLSFSTGKIYKVIFLISVV